MKLFLFGAVGASAINLQKVFRKGNPEPWACWHDKADQYMGTVAVANSGQKVSWWDET